MSTKIGANQCEPLHAQYGAENCCLCKAHAELVALRAALVDAGQLSAEVKDMLRERGLWGSYAAPGGKEEHV